MQKLPFRQHFAPRTRTLETWRRACVAQGEHNLNTLAKNNLDPRQLAFQVSAAADSHVGIPSAAAHPHSWRTLACGLCCLWLCESFRPRLSTNQLLLARSGDAATTARVPWKVAPAGCLTCVACLSLLHAVGQVEGRLACLARARTELLSTGRLLIESPAVAFRCRT